MIIYRYLSRQLLATTVSVTGVLLMIIVFGRFIKYLDDAASGIWTGKVVMWVMFYRLPEFLVLIMPLGLFLGILLTYGRMYIENEMVVLEACGVSQSRLVLLTVIPALCMAAAVGTLSQYLGPLGTNKAMMLLEEERKRSALEMLVPGQFHTSRDQGTVTYVEELDSGAKVMRNLFIVHYSPDGKVELNRARTGHHEVDPVSGSRYIVMNDGFRVEGVPGTAHFNRTSYQEYKLRLEAPPPLNASGEFALMDMAQLRANSAPGARAELQWRWALPFLVPVVTYLAVILSRVNPRQGRYLKLLPSIMVYLVYLAVLITLRNRMASGKFPEMFAFWGVHAVFLMLAWAIHQWPGLSLRLRVKRQRSAS